MPENKVWYLGVDPGSAKTGFAWVEADGRIKKVVVLATETLPEVLPQILGSAPAAVILGNGTNCDSIKKMLMENIKFSLPENKLYLKVEGEQSEDINFKNIHPNIEIIKE